MKREFPQALAKVAPRKQWQCEPRAAATVWRRRDWFVSIDAGKWTRIEHTMPDGAIVCVVTPLGPSAALSAVCKAAALLKAPRRCQGGQMALSYDRATGGKYGSPK